MDIQRILILIGLAVTSYMLILAWNEDYGANGKLLADPNDVFVEVLDTPKSMNDDVPLIPKPIDSGIVPQLEEVTVDTETTDIKSMGQLVRVTTDVFDIQIDLNGGDIVKVALPAYPATLETPDAPFVLVDPRNNYVAQSGLIGPSGTDRSGYRPLFTACQGAYDLGAADTMTVTLRFTQKTGVIVLKHFIFER